MIFIKKEIIEKAHIKDYEKVYQKSIEHPEAFWENIAKELLWFKTWNKVLQWQYPYARWFIGAQTNIVYNALDRWQKTPIAEKLALIWIGQPEKQTPGSANQKNKRPITFPSVPLLINNFMKKFVV